MHISEHDYWCLGKAPSWGWLAHNTSFICDLHWATQFSRNKLPLECHGCADLGLRCYPSCFMLKQVIRYFLQEVWVALGVHSQMHLCSRYGLGQAQRSNDACLCCTAGGQGCTCRRARGTEVLCGSSEHIREVSWMFVCFLCCLQQRPVHLNTQKQSAACVHQAWICYR